MGAGVDQLFRDPNLPKQAKICRIVDKQLSTAMNEFLLALIMNHLRGLNSYKKDQTQGKWLPRPYLLIQDVRIGIMGMGQLGQSLAQNLIALGFKVSGWSNSKKNIPGVKSYAGSTDLPGFLNQTDILICLLPLTNKTRGMLNKKTFVQLPKNAFIINVARGDHLVEGDLIEFIDTGHLSGAALDVFSKEPLPQEHPFWGHPKIHITPHIASITNPESVAPQILENLRRMKGGLPLLNEVSREKGY
ncbi:MAG: glyoxylate/hydroxypyruvate reductase A [Bacteroidetes bacterium]|nr:MAG: glyoxylate/hydroxypyruvate reductase A [Bacteroidota bacterium]